MKSLVENYVLSSQSLLFYIIYYTNHQSLIDNDIDSTSIDTKMQLCPCFSAYFCTKYLKGTFLNVKTRT